MMAFDRTDRSVLGRWWWTVDRWTLGALGVLIFYGTVLIMAASPAVAERIGLGTYHFVERHLIFLGPSVALMLVVSLLSPTGVRRLALIMLAASLAFVALTVVAGAEIKGARRWVHLAGFSLQPSEFVKPAFAVATAWFFAVQRPLWGVPGTALAVASYAVVVTLLLLQPDLGMAFVISSVWFSQFFLAGLSLTMVAALVILGFTGLVAAYFTFPHVTSRIDRFLDPSSGDTYQINRSLEAFGNGGLFGTGPGQGTVKFYLPDAHADFVFAVAGEELGLLWCLVLVGLFAFVVLRGFSRLIADTNLFVLLAAGGLLIQFAMQALINMGSSLHLMPTKGMTLPFISYGGSSLLALGIGMGMVLALTRKRLSTGETL